MGGGSWTKTSFASYSTSVGKKMNADSTIDYSGMSIGQIFKQYDLHKDLNPYNVIRECRDSDEHPNTIPVIIGIDVTGSMGPAAREVASKLNPIITDIMEKQTDVEVMIMGIGDLYYDQAPIQASQFESDVRIARQLDQIYFEGGGGGNDAESYTAAWYFGLHNTDLDCVKRGKRGVIITIGDEPLNEDLPVKVLNGVLGSHEQVNVDSKDLFIEASKKFDIYHIHVNHDNGSTSREKSAKTRFGDVIGSQHVMVSNIDGLAKLISSIVADKANVSKKNDNIIIENDEEEMEKKKDNHGNGPVVLSW